jgi:drug/metabolite transporter (DMT)-like permease
VRAIQVGWSFVLVGWYVWKVAFYPKKQVPFMVGNTWFAELPPAEGSFSWRTYIKWGTLLGVAIFISSYTWYFSLAGTSVAGNSAVFQSAPVFVFLLSLALGEEKPTLLKIFAVLACVGGSAAVAFLGQTDPNSMEVGTLYNATAISHSNSSSSGGNWSTLGGHYNISGCKSACKKLDQCNAFTLVEAAEACTLFTCKAGDVVTCVCFRFVSDEHSLVGCPRR